MKLGSEFSEFEDLQYYPHTLIQVNGRSVPIAKILAGEVPPQTDFESTTFSFIKEWLNKTESFKLQTSGSTGIPKEITVTRNQLQQSAQRTIAAIRLTEHDTAFVCLDTKYIAGKMMLVRALEGNMKIVASEPSSNPIQSIQDSISFTALVPLQLHEIFKNPASIQKLNQLKAVIIGGGSVNTSLQKEIKRLSCAMYSTYGMTETVSHIALQRLNGNHASDSFTVLPGITIDRDERGCLVIKMPEFDDKIITNDLVEKAGTNEFRWLGRFDNIINSGGHKISPEKIEKTIEGFIPEGKAFFVTGFPDDRLGEKLVLIMEGSPVEIDLTKLPLHPYEIPKEIIYMTQFIRTETGKISRSQTKPFAIR